MTRRFKGYFLIALYIGLLVFFIFVFWGANFLSEGREAARAMQCENHFKQTVLALHNYHDTFESLPAAVTKNRDGKPAHSWRGMISPFMEDRVNFYHFDEPWDGPNNRPFALNLPYEVKGEPLTPEEAKHTKGYVPPGVYPAPNYGHMHACPSQNHGKAFITDMVAVVGEETAWPDSKRVTLSDITDAHDTTILIVEIDHSDILWTEPRDLRFDLMHFEVNSKKGPSISSPHPKGPAVAFADASVARLGDDIPPEIVKAMLTIAGGEKLDKAEMVRKGWLR